MGVKQSSLFIDLISRRELKSDFLKAKPLHFIKEDQSHD